MKKPTQTALRNVANTLTAMVMQMIEEAQADPQTTGADLERLASAFSHALASLRSFDSGAKKSKKEKTAKPPTEEDVIGSILLPPIMERDADE